MYFRCIQGLLKDKAVVLVTHQLQFAQLANKILVIKEVFISTIINDLSLLQVGLSCL